jgi:hypothetical protein
VAGRRRRGPSIEALRPWVVMGLGAFGFTVQVTGTAPKYEAALFVSLMLLLGGGWDLLTRFFGGGGPQQPQ